MKLSEEHERVIISLEGDSAEHVLQFIAELVSILCEIQHIERNAVHMLHYEARICHSQSPSCCAELQACYRRREGTPANHASKAEASVLQGDSLAGGRTISSPFSILLN